MLAKRRLLAILIIGFFTASMAFSSGFRTMPAPALYRTLCEVNAEWKKKPELAERVWSPFEDDSEVSILKTHLMLVEDYLRNHPPAGLDPIQLSRRNHHLDVLNQYWNAGAFPNNPDFPTRTPYFIGKNGNFCAVGYVMWQDGQQDIVKLIEKEINNAYVREIPYVELGIWAKENGFLVDELAWIQPLYGANHEYLESFWYEHRGGNVYRIWLNTSVMCTGFGFDQTWQDTTGFSITPVGCSVSPPIGISPWTRAEAYNIYSGCNFQNVVCSTAGGSIGKAALMYKDFVFPVSPCNQWNISKAGGPRFGWGTSGNQSSGGSIWIGNSTIDLLQPNHSPRLTRQIPAMIAIHPSHPTILSIGGIDPDGDSISYHLDTCRISAGTPSSYYTPSLYSQASPQAPFGTDFPINLDATTGQLTISAGNPVMYSRKGAVCIRMDEHRDGIVINSSFLEFSIDVIANSPYKNPEFSSPFNISGGNLANNQQSLRMCIGDTLTYSILLSDSSGDSNMIVHDALPSGATMIDPATGMPSDTIISLNPQAIVQFVPTHTGWHQIPVMGYALRCPIMGISGASYRIYVSSTPNPTVQETMTGCSMAQIEVNGLSGFSNWVWGGQYMPQGGDSIVSVQYPSPGSYPYQFSATNASGCSVNLSGTMVVPNIGQPNFTVTTAQTGCLQASFAVVPNGGSSNWTYQWSGDGGVGGTGSGTNAQYPAGGTYNWSVTVEDSTGCQVTQSNTVTMVDDAPGFSASVNVNGCSPEVELISAPTNPNLPYQVVWSGSGGLNGNPNRYSTTLTHTFPASGTYMVSATYTSSLGCDSSVVLQVSIPSIVPNVWNNNDTLFTTAGLTYQWYRDSTPIPGATGQTFVPGAMGYYSVYMVDSNGCSGISLPIFFDFTTGLSEIDGWFNVFPNPSSDFLAIDLSEQRAMGGRFEIFDLQGRMLESGELLQDDLTYISVKQHPSGLYLLKVKAGDSAGIKTFNVVH